MQFTQLPSPYAPLGAEVLYAVSHELTTNIDLRITDTTNNTLLGAKRFAAVKTATFDAAPYLRRAVHFTPTTGVTGFYAASGRIVTAVIEAAVVGGSASVASAARSFLPTRTHATAPTLLSAMPGNRLISAGECEELTFFTAGACSVTITAQAAGVVSAENYTTPTAGVHLFRLNTADYPEAEYLSVDAGVCGKIEYTVVPRPQGACRVAWRSDAGSIEHYTFPVVASETVDVSKKRAYGTDGHIATATKQEQRQLIRSAYETQTVLEPLTELLTAPQVWLVEGERYTPIDVVSDKVTTHRQGALNCLEIEIRAKHKTQKQWN